MRGISLTRIAAASCAAAMCLVLGACGGLAFIMGHVTLKPVRVESDDGHELHLRFSGAEGQELRARVYELRDGCWSGPELESELPVASGEGEIILSFDLMAESVAVVLRELAGERSAITESDTELPEGVYAVTVLDRELQLETGEETVVAIQALSDEQKAGPGLEGFEKPAALDSYEAAYALTLTFE